MNWLRLIRSRLTKELSYKYEEGRITGTAAFAGMQNLLHSSEASETFADLAKVSKDKVNAEWHAMCLGLLEWSYTKHASNERIVENIELLQDTIQAYTHQVSMNYRITKNDFLDSVAKYYNTMFDKTNAQGFPMSREFAKTLNLTDPYTRLTVDALIVNEFGLQKMIDDSVMLLFGSTRHPSR